MKSSNHFLSGSYVLARGERLNPIQHHLHSLAKWFYDQSDTGSNNFFKRTVPEPPKRRWWLDSKRTRWCSLWEGSAALARENGVMERQMTAVALELLPCLNFVEGQRVLVTEMLVLHLISCFFKTIV